jgi:hypothetical protein
MNISTQWLVWLLPVAAAVVTYGACRWWYGGRLADFIDRTQRIDHALQTSDELVRQARQQIEQLKVEVAFQRQARTALATQRSREQAIAHMNAGFEREAPTRPSHPAQGDRTGVPADGFADTLPLA